jgi:WD40 repeat protein
MDVFSPVGTFSDSGEFFAMGIGSFSAGRVMVYNESLKNLIWENSSIHKRNIIGIDISSDNNSLVTASLDKTAYIWDLKTGALKSPVMQHDVFAWWAKFSPDDSKVVTTTDNNGITIWDAKTGKILTPPFYSRDTILGVEFDETGRKVMCGLLNGEFHEWDIHSGRPMKTSLSHDAPITGTAISAQQDFILTGDESGKIKIWSKSSNYYVPKVINTTNRIGKVAILDNGKKIAAVYENGENSWRGFTIWDTISHEKLVDYSFSASEPERNITAVALASNGKRAAYAVLDEDIINLIETDNLEDSKTIGRHNNIIRDLYFSPDSKYLASVSQDGTSLMFSADKNFENPVKLNYKFGFGGRLTFSKDSSKLAASSIVGSDKNIVKIWETKTGQQIKILPHDYAVRSITFSDCKNAVYTGSSDSYVRLWRLDNQSEEPEFELKHENRVEVMEEYPEKVEESFVLTVTDSGTIRIWDTNAKKVIFGPIQNRSEVPPWQRIITFLRDGEVFLYNHSREILHIQHFPHEFFTQLSPKDTLAVSEFFIAKQRGLEPVSLDFSKNTMKTFVNWYHETENLSSFFIGGEKVSDLADAYSKQNTKISNHNLKLIGDTTSGQ